MVQVTTQFQQQLQFQNNGLYPSEYSVYLTEFPREICQSTSLVKWDPIRLISNKLFELWVKNKMDYFLIALVFLYPNFMLCNILQTINLRLQSKVQNINNFQEIHQ